ncbi:octaprenyl diphosphate synthase [Gammaproteobacteria bacterium 53_120_T64]|nr:octaprenyl diphosphate synthase [Gammaproteobacteria bacterium 53_120_T64]
MQPFRQIVATDFDAVNQLIIAELRSDVGLVEQIGHYLIDAGGKRLRPLLVLLVAQACSYKGKEHINLAVIIEFIHSATLLHDDVVDTSEMRRGRFTANAQWGNPPSVLVGDFLYSRAFQMLVGLGDMKIMSILADTTNIISEGEVQQLINAKDPGVTEQAYLEVIRGKTAQLFEGAASSAAVLAGADPAQCTAMKDYGYHIGMAFQLVDDALDYRGDAQKLGKNVGDDLAEGKATLPLIHAMRSGSADDAEFVRKAICAGSSEHLERIIQIIDATGGIDYTLETARDYANKAKHCLAHLDDSAHKQALVQLADFAVSRNH